MQDVGQKQVASVLGIQAARANTAPRPFLKLLPQHIAVQVQLQTLLHLPQAVTAATPAHKLLLLNLLTLQLKLLLLLDYASLSRLQHKLPRLLSSPWTCVTSCDLHKTIIETS